MADSFRVATEGAGEKILEEIEEIHASLDENGEKPELETIVNDGEKCKWVTEETALGIASALKALSAKYTERKNNKITVNLNGEETSYNTYQSVGYNIYAPTKYGANDFVLVARGENNEPVWSNVVGGVTLYGGDITASNIALSGTSTLTGKVTIGTSSNNTTIQNGLINCATLNSASMVYAGQVRSDYVYANTFVSPNATSTSTTTIESGRILASANITVGNDNGDKTVILPTSVTTNDVIATNVTAEIVHTRRVGNNAYANGSNSIVFGNNVSASGSNSIAVGEKAYSGGANGVAMGHGANVSVANGIAIGLASNSSGASAIAVGNGAVATATNAVSIGSGATATYASSIALGINASASNTTTLAIGYGASATGCWSIAIGSAEALAANTTAIGTASCAEGENSTVLGREARANSDDAVVIGYNSKANEASSVVIGVNAVAERNYSVVIGANARAARYNSNCHHAIVIGPYASVGQIGTTTSQAYGDVIDGIAIGNNASVISSSAISGNFAIAIGTTATAWGANSTAVGRSATTAGASAIAIGYNSAAMSSTDTVIGNSAYAYGEGYCSIAIGGATNVYGYGSIAIGRYATANAGGSRANYSVAIGYYASVNADRTIQLGNMSGSYSTQHLYCAVNVSTSSDIQDKTGIINLDDAQSLKFLTSLNTFTYFNNLRGAYTYKKLVYNEETKTFSAEYDSNEEYDSASHSLATKKESEIRVGVSAQELVEKLEGIYGTHEQFDMVHDKLEIWDKEGTEYASDSEHEYTVAYTNFIPLIISALKEQQRQIDELKAKAE